MAKKTLHDHEIEDDSTEQEVLPRTKSYKKAYIVGLQDIVLFLQLKKTPGQELKLWD